MCTSTVKKMVESRTAIRNCVINLINIPLEELEEVLEEERNPAKGIWHRQWLTRRESQGASTNLMSELRFEDPKEYRMMLRMTAEKLYYLLGLITPLIQQEDTIM
ncbi:unnamed protein product [Acanthoscelides obtectus]|uniref:Uncharacterized protein n=1 Tax=Acanthoscelides obtectus TaxID=200917 RepID=A0A9P0LK99_ACAOB|nr:unnamed protein product [Acanthoscelides obtectus]CAK1635195.1 hypothetical protein AOBTE_LOCUS9127 [Acanthoscelides obtectus]